MYFWTSCVPPLQTGGSISPPSPPSRVPPWFSRSCSAELSSHSGLTEASPHFHFTDPGTAPSRSCSTDTAKSRPHTQPPQRHSDWLIHTHALALHSDWIKSLSINPGDARLGKKKKEWLGLKCTWGQGSHAKREDLVLHHNIRLYKGFIVLCVVKRKLLEITPAFYKLNIVLFNKCLSVRARSGYYTKKKKDVDINYTVLFTSAPPLL